MLVGGASCLRGITTIRMHSVREVDTGGEETDTTRILVFPIQLSRASTRVHRVRLLHLLLLLLFCFLVYNTQCSGGCERQRMPLAVC
jgi:hypothetical protein